MQLVVQFLSEVSNAVPSAVSSALRSGALVAQLSVQAPFTSEVAGSSLS